MTGVRISALPAAPLSQLTDIAPFVQGGVTVKETLSQVLTLFNANIQLAGTAQVTGLNAALASFLPLSGGTMVGTLLLNTSSPTLSLEAASKGYVDTVASGFTVILAAQAATTANLNATQAGAGVGATLTNAGAMVAFSVDGYSASLNDRILVKDQTLTQHNGVYTVTTVGSGAVNWVLTRATDYDQATEIKPGTLVAVDNGTVNANTSWLETATVVTVDTDPILFSQFTFAPASFLMVANNLSDVANAATSRTNLGLGTAATKDASDNGEAVVASVTGVFTPGNIAVFSDVNGTIQDGGAPATLLLNGICNGRATLTSGVPVTISDVFAAPIVYFTPFGGNQISLFDGVSTWTVFSFTELSIAVPGTTNTLYDLFIYDNVGTLTLELQGWTNTTTRAVNLTLQDGVYVKTGATTRRFLATFGTTSVSGQTEDSMANRFCVNYYNRIMRPMKALDSTNNWNYSTAAYRQSNNSSVNQLNFIVPIPEDPVIANTVGLTISTTATAVNVYTGIGLDSTTVNSASVFVPDTTNNGNYGVTNASYNAIISQGRHFLAKLERGAGVGGTTQIWYGDTEAAGNAISSAISGYVMG